MVENMKIVASADQELTVEERMFGAVCVECRCLIEESSCGQWAGSNRRWRAIGQ